MENKAARLDPYRLKAADRRGGRLGLDRDAGVIGQCRGKLGGLLENGVHLGLLDAEQIVQLCDLALGHGVARKHRIHIEPIAQLARHTPG